MTIRTLNEHGCFGGVQGFYAHASQACAAEMRFSVYRPPQAKDGPVPVLWYLSGLTCTEETFPVKAGAQRFALSYVTGTHNIKVGVTNEQGFNDESRSRNNVVDGLNYDFLNGKPLRLQYFGQPFLQQERQNMELGIFAQDAWKIKRMTLNLGLRYEYFGRPEANPNPLLPVTASFPSDSNNWAPRLGLVGPTRLAIFKDIFIG